MNAWLTNTNNIQTSFDIFVHFITNITDKHSPIKSMNIYKHNKVTKLSEHIKSEIFKRDQLYKSSIRDNFTTYKLAYKQQKQRLCCEEAYMWRQQILHTNKHDWKWNLARTYGTHQRKNQGKYPILTGWNKYTLYQHL